MRRLVHRRTALLGMASTVAALQVLGWGALVLVVAPQGYRVGGGAEFGVGLGLTAFLLGVRHAFDADHIASIDNTARKLVKDGKPAESAGFWFSLGHSTVVFSLSALLAFGVEAVVGPLLRDGSASRQTLEVVGTLAAGSFLIVIGLTNLSALFGVVHIYRHVRAGTFDEARLEHHLHNRGALARVFKTVLSRVDKGWHLYFVGFLMGLGFDTATQVALLVLAGGAAGTSLPWYAVLVLPVLFAAGMTLFDTADGFLMARAYRWASVEPIRRVHYNLMVTVLSVVAALLIGTVVLLQFVADRFDVAMLAWSDNVDMQLLGFVLAGIFLAVWSAGLASLRRYARPAGPSSDPGTNPGALSPSS